KAEKARRSGGQRRSRRPGALATRWRPAPAGDGGRAHRRSTSQTAAEPHTESGGAIEHGALALGAERDGERATQRNSHFSRGTPRVKCARSLDGRRKERGQRRRAARGSESEVAVLRPSAVAVEANRGPAGVDGRGDDDAHL